MLEAYIYDGLRSPIGRHAGKLAPLRPDDLAAEVLKEVVSRNQIDPGEISDVVMGCVTQAGEDSRNVARFPNPKVVKQFGNHSMPETGDNVAKDFGISRQQADEFALASQQKYAKAEAEGFYKGEIQAIELPARRKDAPPVKVESDEHPRRDSTMEALAKLTPLFEG